MVNAPDSALVSAPSCIALIPARAGSRRVVGKNIRVLAGHPLLAYTIAAAQGSGVFDAILVSTDVDDYAAIARHYGAEVPFLRPSSLAGELSPDIEWVAYTLERLAENAGSITGRRYDCFSILRPTSPFRQPETIRRAWSQWLQHGARADSLRAVEKCKQHPGKMWVLRGGVDGDRERGEGTEERRGHMLPLLPFGPSGQPWHSTPYQALPEIYVQNASLEIAWSHVVWETRTIAGTMMLPFLTTGFEGLDINDEKDWWYAEYLVERGQAKLPTIAVPNAI